VQAGDNTIQAGTVADVPLRASHCGPFLTGFSTRDGAVGLHIRQELAPMGPMFAIGAPSPTDGWL
jgi:hypothetical protein